MVHLIGLSGRRGSGKDTVARVLQELQPQRRWQIRSFGDSIKSVCAALTGEDVAPYYSQKGKAERVPTFHRTRTCQDTDTPHSWTPDPGSKLVAVQMYWPPGPEQRFKTRP